MYFYILIVKFFIKIRAGFEKSRSLSNLYGLSDNYLNLTVTDLAFGVYSSLSSLDNHPRPISAKFSFKLKSFFILLIETSPLTFK